MSVNLTTNAITSIINGDINAKPLVQVINIKISPNQNQHCTANDSAQNKQSYDWIGCEADRLLPLHFQVSKVYCCYEHGNN